MPLYNWSQMLLRLIAIGTLGSPAVLASRVSHVSSTENVSPSHKITARSMTF